MDESEALARLRHDLANPLSAILAETQLLLLETSKLPDEVRDSLKVIETQAIRMRSLIRE